jgi:hypothetical protein
MALSLQKTASRRNQDIDILDIKEIILNYAYLDAIDKTSMILNYAITY